MTRPPFQQRMGIGHDILRKRKRSERPVPIIVLPGLGANDFSTRPLRWFLSSIGHHVAGWELGTNRLPVETAVRAFVPRLEAVADEAGETVTLIGWSLGGVVDREVARVRADLVAQVITLGSPINMLGRVGGGRGGSGGLEVPVTSIYSKRDRIVDWRRSVDRATPGARNIEVSSSHAGLGFDPVVWRVVADCIQDELSKRMEE